MLNTLSLRTRLAAIAAAGAIVVLGIAAPLLHRDLASALSDAITEQLAVRIQDLEASLRGTPASPTASLVVSQITRTDGEVLLPSGTEPLLAPDELARATRGKIIVDRALPGVGDDARLLARPIDNVNGDTVIGVAATSTAQLVHARNHLALILGVAGPSLVAVVAVAAWFLAGSALRPVRLMTAQAATISSAQTGQFLPQPAADDEIGELARTVNDMLARVGSTTVRQRAFIDDAAHELRTPIAVLRGELELAALEPADAEAVKLGLASAIEETDRLNRTADNLLALALADAGQLIVDDATVDLLTISRCAVGRLPLRAGTAVEIYGEPVVVRGRPEWMEHILTNLVTNANRFARRAIRITIGRVDGNGYLEVADDGPGFPDELIPHAFDRFSRREASHRTKGAGLGLAIVESLAKATGGTVGARNGPPLGGASVTAELPLARQ